MHNHMRLFLFVCFVVSLCLYFFSSVFSGPSFTFVVSLSLCYESLRRVPAMQQRHRRWRKNTSFSLSFGDSRNSVRKKNHFLWILIHTAHFYFFRCLSNFFSENIELLWRRPVVAFILLFASPHHSCLFSPLTVDTQDSEAMTTTNFPWGDDKQREGEGGGGRKRASERARAMKLMRFGMYKKWGNLNFLMEHAASTTTEQLTTSQENKYILPWFC